MGWIDFALIVLTGVAAGFINTIAGGGSLISLPVLIFMGLPPAMANASNRVAIFLQNVSAVSGFKSKGISECPYSMYLGISALFGAVIGAKIAVDIEGILFNRVLAIIMVVVIFITIFKKQRDAFIRFENVGKRRFITIFVFFLVGIYGGFIQAGVGFIIIAILTQYAGFNLVRTNSIKVFVVLVYTLAALAVFLIEDQINWKYGLTLAAGNATGAWVASRWSVKWGEKIIKPVLLLAVIGMAIKLWFV
ncbi:MAG TPA: integrase [Cytophagales bacterium]|jgi:uncharacterized membrane protein YfcA|nr:integrase [Cytophagales bacterium]